MLEMYYNDQGTNLLFQIYTCRRRNRDNKDAGGIQRMRGDHAQGIMLAWGARSKLNLWRDSDQNVYYTFNVCNQPVIVTIGNRFTVTWAWRELKIQLSLEIRYLLFKITNFVGKLHAALVMYQK